MLPSIQADNSITVADAIRVLLANRRTIIRFAVVASALVGLIVLALPRSYTAYFSVTAPQGATPGGAAAGIAAQFGLMLGGSQQASPEYVGALVVLPAVVATVIDSTVEVVKSGSKPELTTVSAFLGIDDTAALRRRDKAVDAIIGLIDLNTDRTTGIVRVSVSTKNPNVSRDLGRLLLEASLAYHERLRRERGAAERRFLDAQVEEALGRLEAAETALVSFRATNRGPLSPLLDAELQKRTRSSAIAVERYSRLLAARDEARLAELRTTPPLTVLELPWTPGLAKRRRLPLAVAGTALLTIALATTVLLIGASIGSVALPTESLQELLRQLGGELRKPWQLLRAPRES